MTTSRTSPKTPLRVLYLSWRDRENPEAGGAETFTERTSEVLTRQGHEVTIFTASYPGASPRTRHGDVQVVRRGSKFSVYLHGMWHLLRHGRDYDIVLDVRQIRRWATAVGNHVTYVAVPGAVHDVVLSRAGDFGNFYRMTVVDLLPDEEPSPFQRICPLADCGNAFSRRGQAFVGIGPACRQ